jgi:hypothetical protein
MGTQLVPRCLSECLGGTLWNSGEQYLGRWSTIWEPPSSGDCQARGHALVELTLLGERLPERHRALCVKSLSRGDVLKTFCWVPSQRDSLKLLPVYLAWHCLDRQVSWSGVCCPLVRQGHSQEPRTYNSTVTISRNSTFCHKPGVNTWASTRDNLKDHLQSWKAGNSHQKDRTNCTMLQPCLEIIPQQSQQRRGNYMTIEGFVKEKINILVA